VAVHPRLGRQFFGMKAHPLAATSSVISEPLTLAPGGARSLAGPTSRFEALSGPPSCTKVARPIST